MYLLIVCIILFIILGGGTYQYGYRTGGISLPALILIILVLLLLFGGIGHYGRY